MVGRLVSPAMWLAAAACLAAADLPPDTIHVLNVGSGWEYGPTADPPSPERVPSEWRAVTLPHRLAAEPCGFFRASFAVPAAWAGYRVSLVVRPLGGAAWVWLNGQLLGVRVPTALDIRLDAARAVRPGARNTLLVAICAPGEIEREGLAACWLEATSAVTVDRIAVSTWCLAQGGVADVALDVANHGRERLEGRLELALEPNDAASQPHPVWQRASDVRMDPGQTVSVAQSFEVDPPRFWRGDDPFLYRLTATVQTREGKAVRQVVRRLGVRSVEATAGRWLANGEWVRLAGIAFTARGATLLCTQPGQAAALAEQVKERKTPGVFLPLDELLDFCDEAGILAFLDAPACPAETPGWRETLDALAAEAALHPSVCGWVVDGDLAAAPTTLARLRELTPRLPVGRPVPDLAADAQGFDFLVSRFITRPGREDDDAYGRRLDDLVRDAAGKPVIAIDRVTEAADRGRADGSLAHRLREVERRSVVAALAFELDSDDALFGLVEKRLCPFRLNPPRHEVRLDGQTFVLKSRFEAQLASPVAQRLPCHSLAGYRIAWRASRGDAQVASGIVPLTNAQVRAIEGGVGPGRGEVEWRTDKPGDGEFTAELQSAAGRVLARHRAKLTLNAKDGKAELSEQPLDKPEAPPSKPPVAGNIECFHLDALAGHFNNDGISWRANSSDGNFDFPSRPNGNSFIADLLPKAGALVAVPGNEAVTFRFPDKDDRRRNNVLCDGQRLQFAKPYEAFDGVWFLGACHDGARAALLAIDYEDGQAQGELRLADWLSKPAAGETDVLRLSARHTFDGKEEPRECGLVAWRVPLDPKRKLMAITLPRERNMHVFAVTLARTKQGNP